MIFVKQSTAVDVVIGPFVDDTDGKTAETALTLSQADCQLMKNGGAAAQKNDATAATHLANGQYKVPLNTTDTNTLGVTRLSIHETGALPCFLDMMVMPANVWDSLFGADYLQVDAAQWLGQTIAAADTNGYPKVTVKSGTGTGEISLTSGIASVNATQISGDSVAADNLEAMLDGTGGVTLTTALTGNITGNLSGSVGSVTGAVGSVAGAVGSVTGAVGSVTGNVGGNVVGSVASVTGNVGGNVVGSVGSVTGAVGSVTGAVGSVSAGGIAAATFAAGAVDASALATDAVTEIVNAVLTTAMTESYNTDGAAPTVAQALMGIMQRVTEFSISGTTITVKKLDGSTTAMTLTLDSATTPTSSTRAT